MRTEPQRNSQEVKAAHRSSWKDVQRDPDDRREVHNVAFDDDIVEAHLCGMTDLRTGRACMEPVRHGDGCLFVRKDVAPGYKPDGRGLFP
jgi:hypothetical protein